ncbi:unnamed protein product [Phytomonas sp. EM1]|nr:unnamed protein product [Phytomonas sp. EM1]|eukprot:CCW63847.1 unnamed protein product [Phytomonas sp. isolate EM1]
MLYRRLEDASRIAAYIQEHVSDKVFHDPKHVNRLLQALSNRPESLYEELMRDFKSEVAFLLEKLLTLYTLNSKTSMTPQAHEFIIRCEQQGVRTAAWAADLQPISGMEPSLLTPRELLKRLSTVDVVGHLQRRIELCAEVDAMSRCVKKMESLFSPPEDGSGGNQITYAIQCQLNSKLISKARRLLTTPGEPAKPETHEMEDNPTALGDPATEDDVKPTPGVIIPLMSEQRDRFKDVVARALRLFQRTLDSTPSGTGTHQPILKWGRFANWCAAHDLIHAADLATVQALEERRNAEMLSQVSQLETVMKLKTLKEGPEEELRTLVDELWRNGGKKCLRPCSLDVLSCLATAASGKYVSQEVKSLIADRLVKTQAFAANPENGEATERIQLPRRALRFVNEQRDSQQHEITTNQRLAAESYTSDKDKK